MTESSQGWGYEIVSGGSHDGFELYEVRFWTSHARQLAGVGRYLIDGQPCDLMNNFKMQIRENHQRIVRTLDGSPRHSSGLVIPKQAVLRDTELATFLSRKGLALGDYPPFHFPTYAGVEEPLDGMFQHESHRVSLLSQAEVYIDHYIDDAIRLRWEGDKRGTTLNLQVGASLDDGFVDSNVTFNNTGTFVSFGKSGSTERDAFARFVSVVLGQGNTVESCAVTFTAQFGGNVGVTTILQFEDADNPAAPSSKVDIDGRSRTGAGVAWVVSETWTSNTEYTSDDFKGALQVVIDRAGWSSGNALLQFVDDDVGGTDDRRSPHSYNSSSSKAPKLSVNHVLSGPGPGELMSAMQHVAPAIPLVPIIIGY